MNGMDLLNKKCVPCEDGTQPMTKEESQKYLAEILGWGVIEDGKKISKEFVFPDFVQAIQFIDKIAEVAEQEGHHPDLHISYSKVRIELWTHAIGGLSENDFILAAKISAIQI